MYIDLKALESYGRTAVHCISEEQAKMFMDAMWSQYPHLVKGIWERGQTNWSRYREEEKSIYYLPRIVRDKRETPYCQSTSLSRSEKGAYTVIEFSELLTGLDLGELPEPVFDIKSLFDMG